MYGRGGGGLSSGREILADGGPSAARRVCPVGRPRPALQSDLPWSGRHRWAVPVTGRSG